jgi:TonB-dependent receptor
MPLKLLKRRRIAMLLWGLTMNTAYTAATAAEANASDAGTAASSLDDVTVVSHREGESVSREKQKDAPNLINTITDEEIRKLPDLNAGEAASRLPGAALSVDTGQGRWVNIRGLDSDLTSTTYAGIHLPPTNPVTPQNGGRAFAFDTFPTGMIGSLTITKTNEPEQDAEALGGTIEISPKEIPDGRDQFFQFRAGSGVQFSRNTAITDLGVIGGLRFGGGNHTDSGAKGKLPAYSDKPFSFVGSLSYYKDALGTDDRRASFVDKPTSPNMAWSNMTQAFYQFHRTTKGAGGELAYQPDADNRWYVRYLWSGYDELVNRDRMVFKTSSTPAVQTGSSLTAGLKQIDKSLRLLDERVSLNVIQLGGDNRIGDVRLDYNAAHTEGKDYRPYDFIGTFSSKPTAASITYNQSNRNYPSYTVTGTNQLDPNTYTLSGVTNNTQLYLTREWSGGINATMPTHLFTESEELKFGAAARLRSNLHTFDPYTSTANPAVNMSQAITGSPVTYYNDHYANGYGLNGGYLRSIWNAGAGAGFATDAAANRFAGGAIYQTNMENVFAVYGQEDMTFGPVNILAGVRVETTVAKYNGNSSVPTGVAGSLVERGGQTITSNGSTLIPVSTDNRYTNVFPSVQARYAIRPDWVSRASFSSTIARPGFNQTNPAATIDAANNIVTRGNSTLKPTTSYNIDLSIEHYFNEGGIASLGVFDKELSNYIVAATQFGGINDPTILAALGPQTTPTQLVTYANIKKARAAGVEFNYDQRYTFLPGFLGGLGTMFNYTYVNSRGDIRPGESAQLPSTSRDNYNAAVYWEGSQLSIRLAGSYVGRNLLFIGGNSSLDQYTEARLSADVSASYALTKHFALYAMGRNLLDTAHTLTEGSSNRIIQRETFGRSVLVGVTGSF